MNYMTNDQMDRRVLEMSETLWAAQSNICNAANQTLGNGIQLSITASNQIADAHDMLCSLFPHLALGRMYHINDRVDRTRPFREPITTTVIITPQHHPTRAMYRMEEPC